MSAWLSGIDCEAHAASNLNAREGVDSGCLVRRLENNEMLFAAGDAKACTYRVESGALFLFKPCHDGGSEFVEFAFAGDYVGMGFLGRHACSARAVAETSVSYHPLGAADHPHPQDERARARLNEAVAREFAHRRAEMVAIGRNRAAVRVAALLLVLSRRNRAEGRDPLVIDDLLDSAYVAQLLGLTIEHLTRALVDLKKCGAVELSADRDLRIRDIAALERAAG
jgi:CRP/FNR family transcriptional regulator, anaerobic regulatory protein